MLSQHFSFNLDVGGIHDRHDRGAQAQRRAACTLQRSTFHFLKFIETGDFTNEKTISILLAVCIIFTLSILSADAIGGINSSEIYSSYVPELIESSDEEIEFLSKSEVNNKLFRKAFNVSLSYFTEEVRLAMKNLSIALKFKN